MDLSDHRATVNVISGIAILLGVFVT